MYFPPLTDADAGKVTSSLTIGKALRALEFRSRACVGDHNARFLRAFQAKSAQRATKLTMAVTWHARDAIIHVHARVACGSFAGIGEGAVEGLEELWGWRSATERLLSYDEFEGMGGRNFPKRRDGSR